MSALVLIVKQSCTEHSTGQQKYATKGKNTKGLFSKISFAFQNLNLVALF